MSWATWKGRDPEAWVQEGAAAWGAMGDDLGARLWAEGHAARGQRPGTKRPPSTPAASGADPGHTV